MKDSTKSIREQMERTAYREHSTPMFLTSSFVYESAEHAAAMFAGEAEGNIYSRFTNPNTTELITKFCALEETESGVSTASGMAAVFNFLAAHLVSGDHVIASKGLFGNTTYMLQHILPQWGINSTFVNVTDHEGWVKAFTPKTRLVLIETPTNPGLELIDIEWLSQLCKRHHALLCVDNCFATPFAQKPVSLGADIVIHSATKWIDGQGRVLGGLILGSEATIQPIYDFLRRTGACMSPFNAWLLSKSTETLGLRMEKHCDNALTLATWFDKNNLVKQVRYPFLKSHPQYDLAVKQMQMGGGIVTVDLDMKQLDVFQFVNQLKIASITANLGDSRTIITHPATTTHSKLSKEDQKAAGISESTLRISVGLENVDDLISDFEQAFQGT